MVSRNVKIKHLFDGEYEIKIIAPELDKIYCKHEGLVHIRITKPEEAGTESQNRTAHALLSAYYSTGLHSAPDGTCLEEFKYMKKLDYGPHWDIVYKGEKHPIPKSWADFTKLERSNFIDALISEIIQTGADKDKKVHEILQGLEANSISGEA